MAPGMSLCIGWGNPNNCLLSRESAVAELIKLFGDGGYAVFRSGTSSWALLRLPTYRSACLRRSAARRFVASGVNLLRDGGSYLYNCSPEDLATFAGIASHNAVQFDGAEPMPRLGRFLWGDWLQLEAPPRLEANSITAAYRCSQGRHQRQLQVDTTGQMRSITHMCPVSSSRHHSLARALGIGDWMDVF